jgi:uncharacterized membrane protein YhhN
MEALNPRNIRFGCGSTAMPTTTASLAFAASGDLIGVCPRLPSLLGLDRFVQPLPLAPLWVLGCYFVAQILILHNTRPTR